MYSPVQWLNTFYKVNNLTLYASVHGPISAVIDSIQGQHNNTYWTISLSCTSKPTPCYFANESELKIAPMSEIARSGSLEEPHNSGSWDMSRGGYELWTESRFWCSDYIVRKKTENQNSNECMVSAWAISL